VLLYDPDRFSATVETIPVTDARMRGSWGRDLHRIVLTSTGTRLTDRFSIRLDAP
jgi:hypothetical protein